MRSSDTPDDDHVVLLADDGTPIGRAPRPSVHTADTPLHLAFSCYLFRPDGNILLTRRALTKRTWPGVWTNSFCGHPRPDESTDEAVIRYAMHELGVRLEQLTCVVPDFRYRAVDASGTVENEICPVFMAVTADDPAPHPDEVAELQWVDPLQIKHAVAVMPWALSPWMVSQVQALVATGLTPIGAATTA